MRKLKGKIAIGKARIITGRAVGLLQGNGGGI